MKKRSVSMLLCAAMLSGVMAGTTLNVAAEENADREPVTLQVQMSASEWQSGWDLVKENFEAEYPWITLEDVGDGQTQIEFINSRIASGDIPPVIQVTKQQIYLDLVDAGMMMDLSELEAIKNTPEYYVDFYTSNDTVFGIAQGTAFSTMYVNMQALREAGWEAAPTTWDEFVQCCTDIAEKTEYSPLVVDAKEPTLCYMILELLTASNFASTEEGVTYESNIGIGEYDLNANAKNAEKLEQVVSFLMPGSAQTGMDDVPALMADGTAAMAIEGNWRSTAILSAIAERTGSTEDAVAILPPFGDTAENQWISASPETGYGIVLQEDKNLNEAAKLFLEWLYTPENFSYMQNVKGTVPVLTNMDESLIKLEEGIKSIVPQVASSNAVLMSFNLFSAEAIDAAIVALQDTYSGNSDAKTALDTIVTAAKNYPVK